MFALFARSILFSIGKALRVRTAFANGTRAVCEQLKEGGMTVASYRHRMVEAVLKDFPDINGDYQRYKQFLDLSALAGGVDGGRQCSPADRDLDRYSDKTFRMLERIVTVVYEAFNGLNERQRRVVALMYWQRLDAEAISCEIKFSVRRVYQLRNEALNLLYRPFLEVQEQVEEWRLGRIK